MSNFETAAAIVVYAHARELDRWAQIEVGPTTHISRRDDDGINVSMYIGPWKAHLLADMSKLAAAEEAILSYRKYLSDLGLLIMPHDILHSLWSFEALAQGYTEPQARQYADNMCADTMENIKRL